MNEIWKDIYGFPYYQVSNLGRVRSFKFGNERILKQSKNSWGYLYVGLSKNGKQYMKRVHRLVAQAFLPNPQNLSQVNHKDENKENCKVDNLEWCNSSFNINYLSRNNRVAKALSKKVLQYSIESVLIKEWLSTCEIERQLGFSQANISKCCRGERKTAYGFIWRYKNEEQI